jgi:hypothetical protein
MEKVLKIKKWISGIHNSNEKRVKSCLKELIPQYKNIEWSEEKFIKLYIEILNSLPARYKQKNSIELNGKIKKQTIREAVIEKLEDLKPNEY